MRTSPDEVEPPVRHCVITDVTDALNSIKTVGDEFVVNDTPWFGRTGDKATPRVVNTAGFISKRFSKFLATKRGWTQEKRIKDIAVPNQKPAEDQRIDDYIELPTKPGFQLDRVDLFPFLAEFTKNRPDLSPDKAAVLVYQMYGLRSCFDLGGINAEFRGRFRKARETGPIRIGLEFETGNIASSFRSLNKLGFLYRRGLIDAGVFVTSLDKSSARRIWPPSNRNSSFEELERLQYHDAIFFPIWEFGFAPDRFDRTAPYLGESGTYTLAKSDRIEPIAGRDYEVWRDGKREFLTPSQPST